MDNPVVFGGILNAALFLSGVIFSSVIANNHVSTVLALMSAAVTVFCYAAQMNSQKIASLVLYITSNTLAAAAGGALVAGYFK